MFEPEVENFLRELYDKLYIRCMDSIRRLYETDYPTISEKFFSSSPWPSVELVGDFYREYQRYHSLIITLYTELYYRHLFLKYVLRFRVMGLIFTMEASSCNSFSMV